MEAKVSRTRWAWASESSKLAAMAAVATRFCLPVCDSSTFSTASDSPFFMLLLLLLLFKDQVEIGEAC
jgi:hypothetical protein